MFRERYSGTRGLDFLFLGIFFLEGPEGEGSLIKAVVALVRARRSYARFI